MSYPPHYGAKAIPVTEKVYRAIEPALRKRLLRSFYRECLVGRGAGAIATDIATICGHEVAEMWLRAVDDAYHKTA